MVAYTAYHERTQGLYVEIACLSTDTKPTENILTGSTAIDVDTGNYYMFDGTDWILQFCLQT